MIQIRKELKKMSELRVTPFELRSQGQSVIQIASELENLLQQLNIKMDAIYTGWTGAAQSGHIQKYNELKPNLKNMQEILFNFGHLTVQVADKFEQVDNELGRF